METEAERMKRYIAELREQADKAPLGIGVGTGIYMAIQYLEDEARKMKPSPPEDRGEGSQ